MRKLRSRSSWEFSWCHYRNSRCCESPENEISSLKKQHCWLRLEIPSTAEQLFKMPENTPKFWNFVKYGVETVGSVLMWKFPLDVFRCFLCGSKSYGIDYHFCHPEKNISLLFQNKYITLCSIFKHYIEFSELRYIHIIIFPSKN